MPLLKRAALALALFWVMELARIIAGETPTCGLAAKLAVANVYQNRLDAGVAGGWSGDADPTDLDMATVLLFRSLPDPTDGALYAIGHGDRERIRALGYGAWLDKLTVTGRFECGGPYFVETLR